MQGRFLAEWCSDYKQNVHVNIFLHIDKQQRTINRLGVCELAGSQTEGNPDNSNNSGVFSKDLFTITHNVNLEADVKNDYVHG